MSVLLSFYDTGGMFGVKRYAWELARGLNHEGATVHVRKFLKQEYEVLGRRVGGNVLKALRNLRTPMQGDLLHIMDHYSNPTLRAADVVTVHDLTVHHHPEWFPASDLRASLRSLRRALRTAHVVTDCEFVRRDLIENYGADAQRVTAIPLGVSRDYWFPDPLPPEHELHRAVRPPGRLSVLLFMSLEPRKRVDLVMEAALQLPFVHVVHVGRVPDIPGGVYDRAREAAAKLKSQGRLVHVPSASDDLARQLISTADLVVAPSLAEGFGLPPLEALACGTPVLATDIPAHAEVLGEAARFCEATVDSIRDHLARAWDGEKLVEGHFPPRELRLAHAGAYSWQRTARRTLEVYEQVRPGAARRLK